MLLHMSLYIDLLWLDLTEVALSANKRAVVVNGFERKKAAIGREGLSEALHNEIKFSRKQEIRF